MLAVQAACVLAVSALAECSSTTACVFVLFGGCRYENTGAAAAFVLHDLSSAAYHAYWAEPADIDQDGDIGMFAVWRSVVEGPCFRDLSTRACRSVIS